MTTLTTLKPVVTFMHGTAANPGGFAEADARAVRIVADGPHKGTLVVERRKRLMGIHVTAAKAAIVYLGDTPILTGYEKAQDVAPVASLDRLGVTKAPKAAKAAKPEEMAYLGTSSKPKPVRKPKAKVAPKAKTLPEGLAKMREAIDAKKAATAADPVEAAKAVLREALKGLDASATTTLLNSLFAKS